MQFGDVEYVLCVVGQGVILVQMSDDGGLWGGYEVLLL